MTGGGGGHHVNFQYRRRVTCYLHGLKGGRELLEIFISDIFSPPPLQKYRNKDGSLTHFKENRCANFKRTM